MVYLLDIFPFIFLPFFTRRQIDNILLTRDWSQKDHIPSFCSTPDRSALDMVESSRPWFPYTAVDIDILEPGFGKGAIFDALEKSNFRNCQVAGFEIDPAMHKECFQKFVMRQSKNVYKLYNADFLSVENNKKYGIIYMNPPFADQQYLDHYYKAISMMYESGSVLVGIIPMAAFYRMNPKAIRFRQMLKKYQKIQGAKDSHQGRREISVVTMGAAICNYPVDVCMIRIIHR